MAIAGITRDTEASTSIAGVVPLGETPGEDDVAIEDRADGVGDRLVHVVALDQDGVEAGDRPRVAAAGPLEKLGQIREHGRRVAAQRGRFARPEPDLALGHPQAGDGVHQEHDMATLVADSLPYRRASPRLHPQQRQLVEVATTTTGRPRPSVRAARR